jgi:hypothetical protein
MGLSNLSVNALDIPPLGARNSLQNALSVKRFASDQLQIWSGRIWRLMTRLLGLVARFS